MWRVKYAESNMLDEFELVTNDKIMHQSLICIKMAPITSLLKTPSPYGSFEMKAETLYHIR